MTPTRRAALLALAAAPLAAAAPPAPVEVAYGAHPRHRLDLYPRPGLARAPMLLFVHGGGWRFGDKRGVGALPAFAERHGLLLASANYRLAPEVNARGCAEDVAAAAAWLLAHGAEHGGDPGRLFLMGHSAGAHLVALVGIDPAYLAARGRKPSDLAGVIPVDGAGYDAPRQMADEGGGPLLGPMYQGAFGTEAAALSPTLLVRPGRAYPPYLIFHVARRRTSREQSEVLAAALRAAGGRAEVVAGPGETHMTINRSMGEPGDPEGERAARFILQGR
jgi:acetyl esterase/lipase